MNQCNSDFYLVCRIKDKKNRFEHHDLYLALLLSIHLLGLQRIELYFSIRLERITFRVDGHNENY